MSVEITRTLIFRANNLGKQSTLLLTFDDERTIPGIYEVISPTAFKVFVFVATGDQQAQFTYKQQLVFAEAEIHGGRVVAKTYIQINPGEQTTLTKGFSKPKAIVPPTKSVKAINDTHEPKNIGLGVFDGPDRQPFQTLVFRDVHPGSNAEVEFIPVLKGYIVTDHREGDILNTPIAGQVLFQENLINLAPTTIWILTYNELNGQYEVHPE